MLTKELVAAVNADIRIALEAVAKKHNLTLSKNQRITYNTETFDLKATFGIAASKGEIQVDPKYLSNMKKHGWKFSLSADDIGKSVYFDKIGKCTILGMSGYTKVVVKAESGIYRCDPKSVTLALAVESTRA